MDKITAEDLALFGAATDPTGGRVTSVDAPIVAPVQLEEPLQYHGDSEYPADIIDTSGPIKEQWQKLDFATPEVLLRILDPFLASGTVNLHPWQMEMHDCIGEARPTQLVPFKYALCAANGSGKDKYIVAPFAIWFCLTRIQGRVIITSSSGTQLTSQTEAYIRDLAETANNFFGYQMFRIRQRYIKCSLTGSEIRLFATDEAGKAEGYHPFTPVSEMAIVINEAKSVSEEIFSALRRCTGYNFWIEVSTPGEPVGHFYHSFDTWPLKKRVTSFECPHLSPAEREADKLELGEDSPLYRSKHLAEFTSYCGQVIISQELINRVLLLKPIHIRGIRRVGIDLAAGGDETVVTIVNGNGIEKTLHFREPDTTVTAVRIIEFLTNNNINKDHDHIFADDGGIGHAIIDMMVAKGWNVHRVNNQSAASNKRLYGNKGAENWYRVQRLLNENLIIPPTDTLTQRQLTTRRYKQSDTGGRLFLESKREAKAAGRPSPDRADSFVLCFTGLTVDDLVKEATKPVPVAKWRPLTPEELEEKLCYSTITTTTAAKPCVYSISTLLENANSN